MASESSNQYLDQKSLFLNLGGLHTGGKRRHLTIQNNIERVYESVLSQHALGLEKIKQVNSIRIMKGLLKLLAIVFKHLQIKKV